MQDRVVSAALRIDRSVALRIAAVGLIADLVIALSTVLPGAPVFPQWPQFVLFPFIFVVHFRTVGLFVRDRMKPTAVLRQLPTPTAAAFYGLSRCAG